MNNHVFTKYDDWKDYVLKNQNKIDENENSFKYDDWEDDFEDSDNEESDEKNNGENESKNE